MRPPLWWLGFLRVLKDPFARLVAIWFFTVLALMLGLAWMYAANSGFGFFFRSCAAWFSEERLALLLILSPIAFAIALSSVGEAVRWMEARRRGRGYNLRFFWWMAGLGGVMLLVSYLLARC